ncbi:hypothetical protein WJX79_002841 [Trebouxia sp. C0005]
MFAGRRAQAYCLSPVPTGGKLLVHTPLPQQEEPKASSQLMASPAPNDERWRVFVSSCANTGVLILANSTTTVSHLQAETVRRHQIQYPEHDVASCRRLYAKHALEQGNHDWWAVADSAFISGFAPPGEVHFHADLFDSAGNQCQPLGQPAAASAAGQPANGEPAAAVMVNPPQPVLPPIEQPLLGYTNLLGHVDDDFLEGESARQESVSGGGKVEEEPQAKRQRHGGDQAVTAQHEQSPSGAPDEPSGKKKRKTAQAAAVVQQQQQQQLPPLRNKPEVDKPASVPTQSPSKVSLKPSLDRGPAASLKASGRSAFTPGSSSDSSSDSSSEGQDVLQAATAALHGLSTEAPSDLTLSGVSSSSSDSSAASASSSSSSDDAASSGAPSSSSPGGSEGSPDAAAAASEEAGGHARGRMSDDSAYDPLEGSMNESDYAAPVEPPTWAHETLSREPALVNAYTSKNLLSLLNSAVEVKGLQSQSAAHLEDEDDQVPARDEQPGPSGAAPARASSAGQNAEDRAKKQSKRASADDKGPLVVSEDSECLDQVAQRPHQDWGKADKLAQIVRRAVKAWLNEDRLTRGLKEVNSNIYINNTAPIWWPLPKWDSTQLHRKADCQKVYMALQKFMREAGQHQLQ